jgi:hypothetical protein
MTRKDIQEWAKAPVGPAPQAQLQQWLVTLIEAQDAAIASAAAVRQQAVVVLQAIMVPSRNQDG